MLLYVKNIVTAYGIKLLYAIVVLIIGLFIINYVMKLIKKGLEKRNFNESARSFLLSITSITLKLALIISIAKMIGIDMSVFIGILSASALAIGLSLQGSLSNLAGGLLIIIFKPFQVGDFIEAQGMSGVVKEIQILYTILNTPDNKQIVIPNGNLSNNNITNYSTMGERRVDLNFGVSYDEDIKKVKEVITRVINEHDKIFSTPEPVVRVSELADSSVNFVVRVWCKTENYWDVHFDLIENMKLEFDKENINIPYPHMDVNLIK